MSTIMADDKQPGETDRFAGYEQRLAEQERPIGPLQALRYHWLIPEHPPTFGEILLGMFALAYTALSVAVTFGTLPAAVLAPAAVAMAGVVVLGLWALAVDNHRLREERGKIAGDSDD